MEVKWTNKALSDLARLYDFLASVNRLAAVRIVQALTVAPVKLTEYPRNCEKLQEFNPREVRRIVVGQYDFPMKFNHRLFIYCGSGILKRIDNFLTASSFLL